MAYELLLLHLFLIELTDKLLGTGSLVGVILANLSYQTFAQHVCCFIGLCRRIDIHKALLLHVRLIWYLLSSVYYWWLMLRHLLRHHLVLLWW